MCDYYYNEILIILHSWTQSILMHHWTQGILKTVEHSPVLVEHSPCQRNHWTQSGIDSWTQSVLGNHWTQSGIDSWTQDVEPLM